MPSINHPTPPGFIRSRGPKGRIVFEPDLATCAVHKGLLDSLGKLKFPNQFQCIEPHLKNRSRFYWKVDLRDAFDSVKPFDVEVFLDIDFGSNWRLFFHKDGGLIQGAPASHPLFNLYCAERLDIKLREYCAKYNLVYTRYVDDILFSDTEWIGKRRRRIAIGIIKQTGFNIKDDKVSLVDNTKQQLVFLGIRVLNNRVGTTIEFQKKLTDAILNNEDKDVVAGLRGWNKKVLALNNNT